VTENALTKSSLSVLEQKVVNAFITDPELSPRNVAISLDLPISAVLEVLKRSEVRKAVGLGFLTEQKDRYQQVRDGVVLALWQMATHDIKDMFNESGAPLHVKDMPAQLRASIKGYKMGKYGPEFQFTDKAQIMLALLAHFGKIDKAGDDSKEDGITYVTYDTSGEEVT
jgi:hypothetical protein